MASYASTDTFSIADEKFYAYRAQDTHGSRCEVYMVNGKIVSRMDLVKAVIVSLGNGAFILRSLFSYELSLNSPATVIPKGRIDFTVNGTTYGLTVGELRPEWRDMSVNGRQVGYQDFAQAAVKGCRSTARVIRDGLDSLTLGSLPQ